jgi:hypothetical protein
VNSLHTTKSPNTNGKILMGTAEVMSTVTEDVHIRDIQEGTKFDTDKLDWTLIPWKELEETVKVLEFGANKYSRDNWKKVDSSRYEKAAMRHLISYVTGEKVDPESGKSHLAHIICNALFLSWKDKQSD